MVISQQNNPCPVSKHLPWYLYLCTFGCRMAIILFDRSLFSRLVQVPGKMFPAQDRDYLRVNLN